VNTAVHAVDLPKAEPGFSLLLPYQQRLIASTANVIVVEKSRRIGLSWGAAAGAVLAAAAAKSAGGMDVLYIGYNLDMARGFISDAGGWAKAMSHVASEAQEFLFKDADRSGDREIQAFRITFASGFEIMALSARPRSLRGKQGLVILDEAAFHDALGELLKAAMALLVWGGRVWVISTHDGESNPFNELVQDTRAGKNGYELQRITFEDAIREGLYARVCLVKGIPCTPEGQAAWEAEIRTAYGSNAAEELDVIPSSGSGAYLPGTLIRACMDESLPVLRLSLPDDFVHRPEHERRAEIDAWLAVEVAPRLDALDPFLAHGFGMDFGRTGDLSVMWPWAEERSLRLRTPFIVELRNVPFEDQKHIVFWIGDRLPRFRSAALDARGNGQFLAEVAMQKWGAARVEMVMATVEFYRSAWPKLKTRYEDKSILVPMDADVLADHRLVRMEKGVAGIPSKARYRGADGKERHGDSASADLLAVHAAEREVLPVEFQAAGEPRLSARLEEPAPVNHLDRFSAQAGGPDSVARDLQFDGF